jgi:predicted ATPase
MAIARELVMTDRTGCGFFLREGKRFFNTATAIDTLGTADAYGGRSLSGPVAWRILHGIGGQQFQRDGLYLIDEPEAALSAQRQLLTVCSLLVKGRPGWRTDGVNVR